MSFALASVSRMRAAYETAQSRLSNIRKANEKAIERGALIGLAGASAAGFGYANERWGAAPANDPSGYKEMTVMGIPGDMIAGGALLAGTLLGAFGKYDFVGLGLGIGSLDAFAYRFGAEYARLHPASGTAPAAAPTTTTSGALGAGAWGPAQPAGRTHHFQYGG